MIAFAFGLEFVRCVCVCVCSCSCLSLALVGGWLLDVGCCCVYLVVCELVVVVHGVFVFVCDFFLFLLVSVFMFGFVTCWLVFVRVVVLFVLLC